jgi:putative NADPH-quinone reductase
MYMKSKILVISGHPDSQSFCSALARAYAEGASESRAEVRLLDLSEASFEPNLKHGYRQRTVLEPDLVQAQQSISWADHLVFVYPNWWGAILKGFFDRVLLPGFAFKYRENSPLWDKLLKGKSARLLVTMDTPSWYNRLVYGRAGLKIMKRNILQFCGIAPIKITEISPVRGSSDRQRAKWLDKARSLGRDRV